MFLEITDSAFSAVVSDQSFDRFWLKGNVDVLESGGLFGLGREVSFGNVHLFGGHVSGDFENFHSVK
jgi:hypothetical protein